MTPADFDRLLQSLENESRWLVTDGLAGISEPIRQFVATAAQIREALTGDASCHIVLLQRHGSTDRLDEGLLSLLGVDVTPEIITDLHCGAPIYNECRLFGGGQIPGAFESQSVGPIVLRGVEYLSPNAVERLITFIELWRPQLRGPIILLVNLSSDTCAVSNRLLHKLGPHLLKLEALHNRPGDIPYAVHEVAGRHAGGLDQFDLEAIEKLVEHSWNGDLAELDAVVAKAVAQAAEGETTRIRVDRVDQLLKEDASNRREEALLGKVDVTELRNSILLLMDEANARTHRLLGVPFIIGDSVPVPRDPLATQSPELRFVRTVSWAYTTFIEAARPNLSAVLRLIGGVRLSSDAIKEACQSIESLRTCEQHHMQSTSAHDLAIIERVEAWFRKRIGKPYPGDQDFERCVCCLLLEIREAMHSVVTFLKMLEADEYPDVIVTQWRNIRERQWEKHRFESIVTAACKALGRSDLRVSYVTEKLLPDLQNRLASCSDDVDKPRVIAAFAERLILDRFPLPMPVSGEDIIGLGVPRGPRIREILEKLKAEHDRSGASREVLLEMAARLATV